jgi:hypothetical protein
LFSGIKLKPARRSYGDVHLTVEAI